MKRDPAHFEPSPEVIEAAREGFNWAARENGHGRRLLDHELDPLIRAALRRVLAPPAQGGVGQLLTYDLYRAEQADAARKINQYRRRAAAAAVDADRQIIAACRTRDAALALLPADTPLEDPALAWAASEQGHQAVLAHATEQAYDTLNAAIVEVTHAAPDAVSVAQVQRALEQARKAARHTLDKAHASIKAERP